MARGLGKIQKWILTEAYRRGERQLGEFKSYTKYYLSRQEIYNDYFNGFNRLNQTKLNDSQYGLKKED